MSCSLAFEGVELQPSGIYLKASFVPVAPSLRGTKQTAQYVNVSVIVEVFNFWLGMARRASKESGMHA